MANNSINPEDFIHMINDPINFKKHVFEKQRFSNRFVLSENMLRNVDIRVVEEYTVGHIISIIANIYGNKFETSVKTPTTAWQHFKHDYFPNWLKEHFPVQYTLHSFEKFFLVPEILVSNDIPYLVKEYYNNKPFDEATPS